MHSTEENKTEHRKHQSVTTNTVDYEVVLEKIGFGKTQWVLLLICGLLTLSSMSAQTAVGMIAIASQCEFNMDQIQKGILMAACVTGIFLSTYLWGFACDTLGRRAVVLYSNLICNVLQLISMFITNVWLFNMINLLMGICLGGFTAGIYPYLSEFNTTKHRAIVINYSTMFVSIAAIYVPATSWLALSSSWSFELLPNLIFRPWRLIILFYLVPGIFGSLMLLPFPESPKFLLSVKKEKEAVEAVNWICKLNTSRSLSSLLELDNIHLSPEETSANVVRSGKYGLGILISIWKTTIPLVRKPHARNFLISAVSVFLMFFSANGMFVWYPEIVNRISTGHTPNSSETVCQILNVSFWNEGINGTKERTEVTCSDKLSTPTYVNNIIIGFAYLLAFIIQGIILNPIGRKHVLLGTLLIAALSVLLLQFVTDPTIVLILFCCYLLMPGLSISIMITAVVDLVPTHLRGKAISICMTLGRLGIVFAANIIGVTLEPLCKTTFLFFTASLLVCSLLVSLLPI